MNESKVRGLKLNLKKVRGLILYFSLNIINPSWSCLMNLIFRNLPLLLLEDASNVEL